MQGSFGRVHGRFVSITNENQGKSELKSYKNKSWKLDYLFLFFLFHTQWKYQLHQTAGYTRQMQNYSQLKHTVQHNLIYWKNRCCVHNAATCVNPLEGQYMYFTVEIKNIYFPINHYVLDCVPSLKIIYWKPVCHVSRCGIIILLSTFRNCVQF